MDSVTIGFIGVGMLLVLLILRIHLGLVMYLVGFVGFWLVSGSLDMAVATLAKQPYVTSASYMMSAIPLFMLMGVFVGEAGFSADAYRAARIWAGTVRGGLAIATVIANALFGAACGSSIAACAVFTKFSLPEMTKYGYKADFACAAIAGAGTLAMLIPPSMLGILYGILTEQSIGKLFIGGIGPGVLLTIVLCIGIMVMVRVNPGLAPVSPTGFTMKEKIKSSWGIWGIALVAVVVLGGIYGGIFTPQEAGAIGAFGAFVIAIIMRKMTRAKFMNTLRETAQTAAMTFFMLLGAVFFGRFLAMSGVPAAVTSAVSGSSISPLLILMGIIVMYLVMGCFMQSNPIMMITVPILFPITQSLGWNPIWFGLVTILTLEIGLLTPPVALNVFVVKAVAGDVVTLSGLFKACTPFLVMMFAVLILVIIFPQIITWLPSLM